MIRDAAEKNGRTMNAEIVSRLQASFDPSITAPNVKFSGLDDLSDADLSEQFTSRGNSAALVMKVANFAYVNERVVGLKADLSAAVAQLADLQQLVRVMERELEAVDGDIDAIAHKRLEMDLAHKRTRLHEVKRRIETLPPAIARAEEDLANVLRVMRAKPSAAE